ncbi:MAG: WD40 repeat domain-containing protein [Bacteroidota bacterium]
MQKTLSIQKIAQLTGHNGSIYALSRSSEPHLFLSGAGDSWIVEWNLKTPENGNLLARVETQIFSLLYLLDYQKIVAGNMHGGLHWVTVRQEGSRDVLQHQKGVFGLQQIGAYLYSIGGGGKLIKWSIERERTVESLQLSHQALRCIDYSPTRHELAVGSSDQTIYILDATTLALKYQLPQAHDNSVFCVRYHPFSNKLWSGGRDAILKVWDLMDKPTLAAEQNAHWYTINDIAFSPSAQYAATASRDKTIKIWDTTTLELLKVIDSIRDQGHLNSVNTLLWSDYENMLVAGSDDRSLGVWRV